MTTTGFRVSVADDVLNQLLAAYWASGAIEDAILPHLTDTLAAIGSNVASTELTLMLPPVARFDTDNNTARITVGDFIIHARLATGETLAKIIISAEIDLGAEAGTGGRTRIIAHPPRVLIQALDSEEAVLADVDPDQIQSLAGTATDRLARATERLLITLPIPGLPGAAVDTPTASPRAGYLILGGHLTLL
jgi:hypothetical protein